MFQNLRDMEDTTIWPPPTCVYVFVYRGSYICITKTSTTIVCVCLCWFRKRTPVLKIKRLLTPLAYNSTNGPDQCFSRERRAKGSRLVGLQPGPSCPSQWPAAGQPRSIRAIEKQVKTWGFLSFFVWLTNTLGFLSFFLKSKDKPEVFLGFSSLSQGLAGPGPGLAPEPALGPHDGQSDPKGRPKGARGHPFSKRLLQKRRHFSEKRPAGGKIAPDTRTFTTTKKCF